jgi:hypothetical protein
MKQLLPLTIFLVCLVSCKKEIDSVSKQSSYLTRVQASLKDSLEKTTFESLDFSKALRSKVNVDTSFLRIPFKGKLLQDGFVLVQTNELGNISKGRIVDLNKTSNAAARLSKYRPYNGFILITDLKGKKVVESPIENGYILAFHKKRNSERLDLVVPQEPYEELPEVIVVGYIPGGGGGGMSFGDFMSFSGLLGGGGYSTGGYYGSMDGYSYGGGGGSGYSGYGYNYTGDGYSYNIAPNEPEDANKTYDYTYEEPAILVDYEEAFDDPAIDLLQYLKCFSNIPDAGSTCSIEIFADIPVDSDPNKILNWQTRSPGHVFLQITKSNGGQRVSQHIGFYPNQGWKVSLTNAPVDGKFVDNEGHEFNASLKMNINPAQLQTALLEMQRLASKQYDIDEYNCTDFALDVFNAARSFPLEIPMYDIPGGITAGGTRTPQGLYNKLKQMRDTNDPESPNITVDIFKGWAGGSTGPCN